MDIDADVRQSILNLNSKNKRTVESAKKKLTMQGSAAIPHLITTSKSSNPVVRYYAVWLLGKSKDRTTLDAILASTKDEDERVRYDATVALGELGDAKAIPYLITLLLQRNDEAQIGSAAGTALIRQGKDALPAIESRFEYADTEGQEKLQYIIDALNRQD